jgi:hypothetical protein
MLIVEWTYVRQSLRAHELLRLLIRLVPDAAVEHDLGAVAARCRYLRRCRVLGHTHDGSNAVDLRGEGDTLRVIASR